MDKLSELIAKYERKAKRASEKEDSLLSKKSSLTKDGYRNLGCQEGMSCAYKEILNDLRNLQNGREKGEDRGR